MTSGGGALAAWVGRGGVWEPFGYVRKPGLRVSDAALLPSGDLLMLEHRYSAQTGSVVRFVRVARNAIVPRQRVEGRELALLEPPLTTENFEGVAIRRGDKRETLIYVMSDGNFNPLRRTAAVPVRDEAGRAAAGTPGVSARRENGGAKKPALPAGPLSRDVVRSYADAAARFSLARATRRFRRRASAESFASGVSMRNASMPPLCSTVRRPAVEMRSFTGRLRLSLQSEAIWRLGRKRRLVRRFEWLTLWPTSGSLPVMTQRRAMAQS